jgi:hypothetical protein
MTMPPEVFIRAAVATELVVLGAPQRREPIRLTST